MENKMLNEKKFLCQYVINKISGEPYLIADEKYNNLNWSFVFDLSVRHKLYYAIYDDYKEGMSKQVKEKFELLIDRKNHLTNLIWDEIVKIHNKAEQINIDVCFLRGIVFSELIYSNKYFRCGSDIDLLVREDDYDKIRGLIQSLDYQQEFYYNEELLKLDRYHQTDVIFGKKIDDNNIWVEILTEKNFIASPNPIQWMHKAQHILINDQELVQFPLAYQCVILFNNVYVNSEHIYSNLENRINLRDYLDIGIFCNKYAQLLDWQEVYHLADKCGIANEIYCVMLQLNQLIPNFFNAGVLKIFSMEVSQYPESVNNPRGTIMNWDIPFMDRLMNDTLRKEQCFKTLKRMINSELNANFNHPGIIFSKKELQKNEWLRFSSETENIHFLYRFYYDSNNLYFELKEIKNYLKTYFLRVGFICSQTIHVSNDIFDLDLYINPDKVTGFTMNNKEKIRCDVNITENGAIFALPFTCFGFKNIIPDGNIYYNIVLIKEISKNVYKNVDYKFNYKLSNRINYPCIKLSY